MKGVPDKKIFDVMWRRPKQIILVISCCRAESPVRSSDSSSISKKSALTAPTTDSETSAGLSTAN